MITIEKVKCDKCGELVSSFYSRDGNIWFGKYLNNNEERICLNCIKNRKGFRKEFKLLIGISVNKLEQFRRSNKDA